MSRFNWVESILYNTAISTSHLSFTKGKHLDVRACSPPFDVNVSKWQDLHNVHTYTERVQDEADSGSCVVYQAAVWQRISDFKSRYVKQTKSAMQLISGGF